MLLRNVIGITTTALFLIAEPTIAGRAPYYDYGNVIHSETIMKTVEVMVPEEECLPVASNILYPAPNHLRYILVPPPVVAETIAIDVKAGIIESPAQRVVKRAKRGVHKAYRTVKNLVFEEDIYPVPKILVENPLPPPIIENDVVCNTVHKPKKQQVFDGYKVTYVYNGQTFVIRTAERPGRQIQVLVTTTATPVVH